MAFDMDGVIHRLNMQAYENLIAGPEELEKVCRSVAKNPMLALDTEFIRESTFFPQIALIQIANEEQSWLIDPLAFTKESIRPLLDLFSNPGILKILHAAQADQECLYTAYGVVATPSFDTAVGASLCGLGNSIGLAKLLRELLGISLPKGHARTDWKARPLSKHLMTYAHQDVQYLIAATRDLFSRLDGLGRRQWAMELSAFHEDTRRYEPNPEAIAQKLTKNGRLDRRGRATLLELLRWREARVRELNVPRRWVADDDILVALSSARPKDMDHLSTFRGLNRGELKRSGAAILDAIECASKIPNAELPEIKRHATPDESEARAVELIQCFVKVLADGLKISPRHLILPEAMVLLLRGGYGSVDELVSNGLLTRGAGDLIGADLLDIVQGKCGLSVRNGTVCIAREGADPAKKI